MATGQHKVSNGGGRGELPSLILCIGCEQALDIHATDTVEGYLEILRSSSRTETFRVWFGLEGKTVPPEPRAK